MRIAQVSPLFESCPPQLYGGTERIVSYLTERLVQLGHDVTLFASGDSVTSARLEAPCPRALRLVQCADPLAHHMIQLSRVARLASEFDIIHFHTEYLHFPIFVDRSIGSITTMHGRLDLPDLPAVFAEFPELRLVSISDSQRGPVPWASWVATVHHGLPLDLYRQGPGDGGYLAFLGRFSPEKGSERAIEIARRCGRKIKLAAKVDQKDEAYFADTVQPLLRQPHVEYVGEIGEADKQAFLGEATALLFPIDWPEPFGLVMIEAMATGTPIIAFRRGAVPEIVDHGVTGFVVEDMGQALACLDSVEALDRGAIRASFEQRFSVERMADDYLAVYRRVLDRAARAADRARARPQEPDLLSLE